MPRPTAFELARAEERQNRLMAYLRRAPTLCGLPVLPLTARALIELEFVRNPCVVGGTPSKEAVFDFLWRLNPDFAAPRPGRERLLVPPPTTSRFVRTWRRLTHTWRVTIAFGSRRIARAYRRVERTVAAKDFRLLSAFAEINARRARAYQDQATPSDADAQALKPALTADRHWIESFIDFYCADPGKWKVEDVLDAPLAQLFQIFREHELARDREPGRFIAPSDALIGPPPAAVEDPS